MANHYAFAVPILPGQLEAWKSMVNEIKTTKRRDYESSRKKLGVKHERVWLERTPNGDFVVVSVEGTEPEKLLERFNASKDPFDQWFVKQITAIHGLPGPPPSNELYLDEL